MFAVVRARGPAWDEDGSLREQDGWNDHASFMDTLADEGFVVLGGPIGDGSRALLAIEAAGEGAVRARLAADPWRAMGLLTIVTVEPWTILLRRTPTTP